MARRTRWIRVIDGDPAVQADFGKGVGASTVYSVLPEIPGVTPAGYDPSNGEIAVFGTQAGLDAMSFPVTAGDWSAHGTPIPVGQVWPEPAGESDEPLFVRAIGGDLIIAVHATGAPA